MVVLVPGAAGFIGYHVCEALLGRGERVVGIDSLNDYYDPALKRAPGPADWSKQLLVSQDRRHRIRRAIVQTEFGKALKGL